MKAKIAWIAWDNGNRKVFLEHEPGSWEYDNIQKIVWFEVEE